MEQLQLRKGYLRCINCATIFDGFEAVVPVAETPSPVAATPKPTTVPEEVTPPAVGLSSVPIAATPIVQPAVVQPTVVRHRSAISQPAPYVATDLSDSTDPVDTEPVFTFAVQQPKASAVRADFHVGDVAKPDTEPAFRVGSSTDAADQEFSSVSVVHRRAEHLPVEPMYVEARSGAAASGRVPSFSGTNAAGGLGRVSALLWQLAVVLALVVLMAQLVYIYRAQIASQIPTLRPLLERACAELNCTVPYARRIDMITIAGAALSTQKQAEAGKGSTMQLQLTLRNTYSKPQEWPTLELDLNDFSGTLQVRKNIGPDIYLTEAEQQQPFAANAEKVLRLPIALNGLSINGFQVRKFFP